MIIMINGAFGVGKTTIAKELLKIIKNSMLFDPEEVGCMLRKIITDYIKQADEKTDNFQDLELWKVLTVKVAELLKIKYDKNLIVPMAIFNKDYFQDIFNGFKSIDEHCYHFCLIAKEETINQRLRLRGESEGNWCYKQTKKCVEAYKDECFQKYIVTDNVCVTDIVKILAEEIN